MSSIKKREQNLLLFLLRKQDYVTSELIARELEVSIKTIYRLVKKINDDSSHGILILSEKGRGYKLNYENYLKSKELNKPISNKNLNPKERQKRVMEELLIISPKPIPIHKLYENFFVGESGISNDEQAISQEMKKYNLELIRKNRSLSVIGEEKDIRRALREISNVFNFIDIEELKNNHTLNFNKYDVLFIVDQIRFVEHELDITIPYPYNVNIFSHIYILLSRVRKNLNILSEHKISKKELKDMKKQKKLLEIAIEVVKNIENYLQIELPEAEIYFLFQYLVSSRMQSSANKGVSYSITTINVTNSYIKEMEKSLNLEIDSETIFVDLANHIKPMLNRLEHGIQIKNMLLNQIEINYESVFFSVKKVSQIIEKKYSLPVINKDEIGFITLYFAKVVETTHQNNPIKTLIMCTTGIGTSELLKVKIEKNFSELEIIDVVSSRNTKLIKHDYPEVELVISTVEILEEVGISTLLVSAMFTKEDQKRLEKKIGEIK